jgi:CheY-like chemotaxis protein
MGKRALRSSGSRNPFDVILLDWRMPVMDGPAFLRSAQKDPALKSIPIMMLTGLNEMEDVTTALKLGAKEYLMKPITQRTLKEKLSILGLCQ